MTLEQLLRTKVQIVGINGPIETTPDFRVAVQGERNGGMHFIIHPSGHNGATLDFIARGNRIRPIGASSVSPSVPVSGPRRLSK